MVSSSFSPWESSGHRVKRITMPRQSRVCSTHIIPGTGIYIPIVISQLIWSFSTPMVGQIYHSSHGWWHFHCFLRLVLWQILVTLRNHLLITASKTSPEMCKTSHACGKTPHPIELSRSANGFSWEAEFS